MSEEQKRRKAEYMKKWAEKNKEHLKEYSKQYRNSEKGKAIILKYYEEHKDEIYKSQTEYRHRNAKKVSKMVYQCRKRKAEELKSQGIKNAWSVLNYGDEPRYTEVKRGRKKKVENEQ